MPRSGVKGKQGFQKLGPNEAVHRADGVVELALEGGLVCLVDEEDYHLVCDRRWYVDEPGYLASSCPKPLVRMHRLLMGMEPGDRRHVDHENLDKLDNRRANLRLASCSQNHMNKPIPKSNTSGFKGVSRGRRGKGWRAYIKVDYKQHPLGVYATPEEAARAYDEAALRLHGPFARLNFGNLDLGPS